MPFGRSDLEVRAGERHWILELKIDRGEESSKEKLREGVAQMLSEHYGDEAVSKEKDKSSTRLFHREKAICEVAGSVIIKIING